MTTGHSVISEPAGSDYPALVELWEAAVRATHHFLSEADIVFFREKIAAEYLSMVRLHVLNRPAGDIAAFMGTDDGKLEMLFVQPRFFGQGYGSRLLEYAVNELGVTAVDVNADNPAAAAFYRKAGFVQTGRSELDPSGRPFPILHLELNKKTSFIPGV